tara:strand:+ start:870 stop:1268 length:399 start_codon:yes stop_codon:yes gene_type:complete
MTTNFKKLAPEEITERIQRIGGEGWVTPEDYKRFSRQSVLILEALAKNKNPYTGKYLPRTRFALESASGSKRVASRIDELRDEFEIETSKYKGGATYRLVGRRWEARTKKPHCSTCNCFPKPVPQEQGRMEL